jgi:subfamily B ATP-binding cassette protein MsbA
MPGTTVTPETDGAPHRMDGLWACLVIALSSMRRHPFAALAFLGSTIGQGVAQALLIWTLRSVLLALSEPAALTAAFLSGCAAVFGVWVLRSASVVAADALAAHLAFRLEVESMWQVLARLLQLPVRFFDVSGHGNVVMSCHLDVKGVRTVMLQVGKLVLHLSQLAGLAVVAWWLNPQLTMVGLLALPVGVLPAYLLGQRITRAARLARSAVASHYDSFLQIANGIRFIKVNRCETRIYERAREIGAEMHKQAMQQTISAGVARFLLEMIAGLGLVVVLFLGGRSVAAGTMDWQSLLSLMIAIMAVYSPLIGLLEIYNTIRSTVPSLQGLDRALHEPLDPCWHDGVRPMQRSPGTIELRNVSFAYGGSEPVLRDVSLSLRQGETIGLVGPSGAGKSTLISLLLRFYSPTSGNILVDGVDLQTIAADDWMDQCALVQQEPFLFVDTVANNIRAARPGASMAEVEQAARAASIHDDILEMDCGYETVVGRAAGGRGMSGGQKQRVCIAAALLKNAPLLFLDEATNSLDTLSEHKVQAAIERLMRGRTTVVVAHRFSTLRRADRIIVLDRGRIAGIGPHHELVISNPIYRALWRHQAHEEAGDEEPRAAS